MKTPLTRWKHCCTIRIVKLPILAIIFLLTTPLFSYEINLTHCDLSRCKIDGRCSQDISISCEAIKRAIQFFKISGYEVPPCIDIKFVKNMYNENKLGDCKPTIQQFVCHYNKKTKCIKISSWIGSPHWSRTAFGVFPIDLEFFISMLTHEVAHRFFDGILESRGETSDHSFHEFIAYITQIETMNEPHKSKVLSLWPGERLPTIYAINLFFFMAEPNKFAVLSYNFFKSQPMVIKKILGGKIKPIEKQFIIDY